MKKIFTVLVLIAATLTAEGQELNTLRNKIDSLDNQLVEILAERMKVCRDVGEYKIQHDLPVLQQGRFDAILEKRSKQGEEKGMSSEFMRKLFTDIHDESCRQQEELMKKK